MDDDTPIWLSAAVGKVSMVKTETYCKIADGFYVIYTITNQLNGPFHDSYQVHGKMEIRQKIKNNQKWTNVKGYYAINWLKTPWLKSQIEAKIKRKVKKEGVLYQQFFHEKIAITNKK